MNQFTTILWDVDGTLLDFLYSQKYAITKCFRSIGREITEEQIQRYSKINDGYWKRLELGEVTKEQLFTGRFVELFHEYRIENIDVEAFAQEYQEALGSVFSYLDDSLEVCRTLQGRVRQYVVTNGATATQRGRLELSGLAAVMDDLFISEEVGVPKPYRAFFDYVMAHIEEKDKSRILIVGDSISSDIKGGIQAGIATCWYRPEGTAKDSVYRPDYEISDLHALFDILGVL
ncbi:MAG: YjjG family noncanonical pyrimidine nucleotidase [Acetatifactor sp.]|nr:YjjG family noncanonical pyrimidine nucleotidase [Acetatifactor sp.]